MDVKVNTRKLPNGRGMVKALGLGPGGELQRRHAENIRGHILPYMPMVSGSLIKQVHISRDGTLLTVDDIRAGFLHGAKLMVDPNTGSSYARRGQRKVVTRTPLVYNQEKHPKAGGKWETRMMAADGDKIRAETQEMVNRRHGR